MKRASLRDKRFIITIVIMVAIVAASVFASYQVKEISEASCWDRVHLALDGTRNEIEGQIITDHKCLEIIAHVLGQHNAEELPALHHMLSLYGEEAAFSHLEMMFPDNTVMLPDGTIADSSHVADFEEVAAGGEDYARIGKALEDPEQQVLRNYMPIIKDGETVAMLCGVVYLDSMTDQWTEHLYDGQGDLYIVDRETGDFLLDTWHAERGNVKDLDDREMREEGDENRESLDVLSTEEGDVVFKSESTGEYLYFHYAPMDLVPWTLAISVPESIAMARANQIGNLLFILAGFEAICFFCYLFWMYRSMKRENLEIDERLQMVNYTHSVEKILFSANNDETYIVEALQKVADITAAQVGFLKMLSRDGENQIYLWSRDVNDGAIRKVLEEKSYFAKRFEQGQNQVITYDFHKMEVGSELSLRALSDIGIRSLMEVPIRDENGDLAGILGVMNMYQRWETTEYLENVALSFGMFYKNMRLFEKIREMGEVDILTGLKNRNSYEKDLEDFNRFGTGPVGCLYADANGLHARNNRQGHAAGDQLLQTIAEELKKQFPLKHIYRTGGDEFVVLLTDRPEETLYRASCRIKAALEAKDCSASIGICVEPSVATKAELAQLIVTAEQRMYQDKQAYYADREPDALR